MDIINPRKKSWSEVLWPAAPLLLLLASMVFHSPVCLVLALIVLWFAVAMCALVLSLTFIPKVRRAIRDSIPNLRDIGKLSSIHVFCYGLCAGLLAATHPVLAVGLVMVILLPPLFSLFVRAELRN